VSAMRDLADLTDAELLSEISTRDGYYLVSEIREELRIRLVGLRAIQELDALEELRRQYVVMPEAKLYCLIENAAARWNHEELTRCFAEYKEAKNALVEVIVNLGFRE